MKFLMLNKIRQQIKLFISYWYILIGFGVLIYFAYAYHVEILDFANINRLYINGVMMIIWLLMLVLRKNPIIMINAASVYHLRNSSIIKRIIVIKFVVLITAWTIASMSVTVILFKGLELFYFMNLTSIFVLGTIIMWKKYHHSITWSGLFISYFLSISPFLICMYLLGACVNLMLIVFLLMRKSRYRWNEYLNDMRYIYTTQAVASRKDFGEMMTMANENSIKGKYKFAFPNKTKVPLLAKAFIIDTLRSALGVWIACGTIFICSISIPQISFFEKYWTYIFVVGYGYTLCLLLKHNSSFLTDLIIKSRQGLFIPYSPIKLSSYYSILPAIQMLFLFTIVVIILGISASKAVVAYVLTCMVTYGWMYTVAKRFKYEKLRDAVSCIIIYGAIFYIIF